MPDNSDSIMVVCDDKGQAAPSGWTRFQADGLIARRVGYADIKKLDLVGYKAVLVSCFQFNSSGSTPFRTNYDGNDAYSIEHNAVLGQILVSKNKASGGGAGTTRNAHKESAQGGGTLSESWSSAAGQVPLLGAVFQDAGATQTKVNAAKALTTDNVPLG